MRIDAIDIYRVSMPLVYPFRTAFGNDEVIESLLVRMRSGDAFGWGEATPWQTPGYSAEFAAGAFLVLRDFLAPRLVGMDIPSGTDLQARLAGRPFIFKLAHRIEDDLERIERLRAFETQHNIDLSEYVTMEP